MGDSQDALAAIRREDERLKQKLRAAQTRDEALDTAILAAEMRSRLFLWLAMPKTRLAFGLVPKNQWAKQRASRRILPGDRPVHSL
jgi:hypothetical protein